MVFDKRTSAYILKWAKKLKAIEMLGGECTKCGDKDVRVLEFHHRDPTTKVMGLNKGLTYSWSKVIEEIKKCDLLCCNCHSELHEVQGATDGKGSHNKEVLLYNKGVYACECCGYDKTSRALQFHHTDPENKELSLCDISLRLRFFKSIPNEIKKELDKCEILCGNCHTKHHIMENGLLERHAIEIINKKDSYKEQNSNICNYDYIKEARSEGFTLEQLAELFNTSKGHIHYIVNK